jgi:hypothetical protein
MKNFIEHICDILLKQIADNNEPILVLPNKRPVAYMQKYMAAKMGKAIWFPKIFTIEDYVLHLTQLQVAEPAYTASCLYAIYNETLQDQADAFDDFLKWWNLLISDFNDIDMYMVDTRQLFSYINEAKAIEEWNPGQQQVTKLQQQYLIFWKYLPEFYHQLNEKLLANKLGYRGMLYKKSAIMHASEGFQSPYNQVIFAGFNALSTSEEMIIDYYLKNKKGAIYWECDDYYLKDEQQEAGKFLRYYKNKWQNYSNAYFISNNSLLNQAIEVNIIGAPKSMMQAATAGKLVNEKLNKDFKNIALIPADETLLSPLLYQLPHEHIEQINISMGYPVLTLPLYSLYVFIFEIIHEIEKEKQAVFSAKAIHQLFSHPYTPLLFTKNNYNESKKLVRRLIQKILASGKLNFSLKEIKLLNEEDGEIDFYWLFECIIENVEHAYLMPNIVQKINEKIALNSPNEATLNELIVMQVVLYKEIIDEIKEVFYIGENTVIKQSKTLLGLINQSLLGKSLPFIGNSTGGLQFIGLLETRMLQFDEIIITGCNEGILPSAKASGNSFIPFDIRYQFNLPTYKDSEAVFAYHFYRLIQGAKKVHLIYNTETDEFGSGEKSRFLIQLEMELRQKNPKASIKSDIIKLPALNNFGRKAIEFNHDTKTEEALKILCEKGLSATALIAFKNCSLQFYFKYIERIQEPNEIALELGANIVGSVIHAVLEQIYAPLKNQLITAEQIQIPFEALEDMTRKAFEKIEAGADSNSGKNLLFIQTAVRIIANFLTQEKKALKNGNKLQILHTEQAFDGHLSVANTTVKLRGTIDRLDEYNNKIRIIDYKTGNVDASKLKVNSINDVFEDSEYDKAFQLLFYTLLYRKNYPNANKTIEAGILSLRKISEGLQSISCDGEPEQILHNFEQHLVGLINQLLDNNNKFTQTKNTDICSYCAFADICMR